MVFSIITPSFRNSSWLKLCVASVADQQVELEHIVQDAGSDDGTLDWVSQDKRVKLFVEKDSGMYDAINRALRRSKGDILAYLNCDEQYLPGALKAVSRFFNEHPEVDVVFGDIVMVDPQGDYLYHRKVQTPLLNHTWTCQLSTLSCAMFFRKRLIVDDTLLFQPQLRAGGDGEWMVRALQRKTPMAVLGTFTSAFTCTGRNLGIGETAESERLELARSAPAWRRAIKPFVLLHHRIRRLLGGMYFQRPFSYEIYTSSSPIKRTAHEVKKPKFRPPA